MSKKIVRAFLGLAMLLIFVPTAQAADHASGISVGLVGAYPIDGADGGTRPFMIGGETEVGFKDSPVSYKLQGITGTTGWNQTETVFNLFVQYQLSKLMGVTPYVGLGYANLSLAGNTSGGISWIAGADYYLSPAFKMGIFYSGSGSQTISTLALYNHFIGLSLGYHFAF